MKMYLLSLGAGVLVGVVYSLLGVRSAWRKSACTAHLFGTLPGRITPNAADPLSATATKESQG